jgi:hypothetical protein
MEIAIDIHANDQRNMERAEAGTVYGFDGVPQVGDLIAQDD